MPEIVYLLTNPTMPDLVKIGRTTDLESRLRSLSTHSGVPVPFECFYACEVADSVKVERALHDAFGDHRINPKREFFRLNPDRAVAILELVALKDAAPCTEIAEDQVELDALHREQSRREQFRFSMVDVPVGATLTFSKDDTITAKVIDDKRIEFEGNITSTSAAATKLLHRRGWTLRAAQGPLYWMYDGETLAERRMRMEDGADSD
ncbi:MAG: GIY-YIG nuclease family protein [Sphingomonadaceae bacterium]|nr:GIY-YIG nuclease family protein [Sphingomonadaceae bacterium]